MIFKDIKVTVTKKINLHYMYFQSLTFQTAGKTPPQPGSIREKKTLLE